MPEEPFLLTMCPQCGASEMTTEPAVHEAGQPTGEVISQCAACGSELAVLPPREPGPDAPPDATEWVGFLEPEVSA
jgi:hypothetical protein